MNKTILSLAAVAAIWSAPSIAATTVPNGTVSSVGTFNPSINVATTPSTYSAFSGGTFEVSGTGAFANIGGTTGTLNGTLSFAQTIGTTIAQSLANFFVFSDAAGGTYNYSVSSVTTNGFVNFPGIATSGTLYLLGNISDANLGYTIATPSSLTVQFNSTGGSNFSSSLTLAVPPAGAIPEPATWALMLLGFGMIGATIRYRRRGLTVVYA